MPKQVSLIKIAGTVDDLSFYASQDGNMARKKARYSIEKFKTDPNYLLTRLNASEFGIGGTAGKTFREAFTSEINRASDGRVISRLTQAMIKILQTDATNEYGFRQAQLGNFELLEGFDFNIAAPMSSLVSVDVTATVNRVTGAVNINIPAHLPTDLIKAPSGVTHYRYFMAAASIDFENQSSSTARQTTANMVYQNEEIAAVPIVLNLPPNSTCPLVLVFGVEFMKVVNAKVFPFSKKASPLTVLAIDMP